MKSNRVQPVSPLSARFDGEPVAQPRKPSFSGGWKVGATGVPGQNELKAGAQVVGELLPGVTRETLRKDVPVAVADSCRFL